MAEELEELTVRGNIEPESGGQFACGEDEPNKLDIPTLEAAEIHQIIENTKDGRPAVLKFGKHFCGWTKTLNQVLIEEIPQYKDKVDFFEINLPDHPHLFSEWNIETSPMMILIRDGKEIDRSDAAEAHEVPPVFKQWFSTVH